MIVKNWKTTIGGIMLSVGVLFLAGEGTYKLIGTILMFLGGLLTGVAASDAIKK